MIFDYGYFISRLLLIWLAGDNSITLLGVSKLPSTFGTNFFLVCSMCKVAYSSKTGKGTIDRRIQYNVVSTLQVYLNAYQLPFGWT